MLASSVQPRKFSLRAGVTGGSSMSSWITNLSAKFRRNPGDDGQTLVEYALIIGVFSTLMVASLGLYQGGLSSYFSNLVTTLVGYF